MDVVAMLRAIKQEAFDATRRTWTNQFGEEREATALTVWMAVDMKVNDYLKQLEVEP